MPEISVEQSNRTTRDQQRVQLMMKAASNRMIDDGDGGLISGFVPIDRFINWTHKEPLTKLTNADMREWILAVEEKLDVHIRTRFDREQLDKINATH